MVGGGGGGSDIAKLTEISWQCSLDSKVKFSYAVQVTQSLLRLAQSIRALAGSVPNGAAQWASSSLRLTLSCG